MKIYEGSQAFVAINLCIELSKTHFFFFSQFFKLKLVYVIFYQIFIFASNDRPSNTMKNVFYFI